MAKIDFVCIVDDDPLYVFGMKKLLGITDFCNEYRFFQNGQEAIDSIRSLLTDGDKLPDVILLDINMPIMNGWQFLDQLIELPNHKDIRVFVVSSSINQEEIDKARSYNIVVDYIFKPFTLEKLNELKARIA